MLVDELLLSEEAGGVTSVSGATVVSGISSQMHFFSHLQSFFTSALVPLVLFVAVPFVEVLLLFDEVSVDLFLLLVLHAWVSTFSVQSSPPFVFVLVLFC